MSRPRPLRDDEIEEILDLVRTGTYVKKRGVYVQDIEADYITRDEPEMTTEDVEVTLPDGSKIVESREVPLMRDGKQVMRKIPVKPKYILVRAATQLYREQQVKLQRSTLRYSIMHASPLVIDEPSTFQQLKDGIVELYTGAQIESGTNVGGYATDALSEPQTQLTLDSHKSTKASKTATTTTARRMTQILQVVKKQRNRNMVVHFKNKHLSKKSVIQMCRSMQACPGYAICDFDESITGEISRYSAIINANTLSITFMLMTGMLNQGEANNTLNAIMTSSDPISVLNVDEVVMRAHDFDIITLTLAINNLQPGLVYAIPYESDGKYKIYLLPDGQKIRSIKQSKASKTTVVEGGAVNMHMNCEFRPLMDDMQLTGVRGIAECVPVVNSVSSYIERVKTGSYIINDEEFNVCLVLNMPKMHEMSIDAARLADVLHIVGIPTALSSKYMQHDPVSNITASRRNLHNYILYARMDLPENDRDPVGTIISYVMQQLTLFKNFEDATDLINIYETYASDMSASSQRIVDTYMKIAQFTGDNHRQAITAQKQALVDINNYYYAQTIGTNLKALAVHRDVDYYACTSDVLYELYDAMDLPAYRTGTVREIANVLSGAGYIPPQHIELTVDNLCKTGAPVPVTANGLTRSGATVVESANRSSALDKLMEGALNNTVEYAHGQLNSVLAARPAKIGTGAMDVVPDVRSLTTQPSVLPSGDVRAMTRREVDKMMRGFGTSKPFMPEAKNRTFVPLEPEVNIMPARGDITEINESLMSNINAAFGVDVKNNMLVKSQMNADMKITMTEDNKYGVITRTESSVFASGAEHSMSRHMATTARIKYPLGTSAEPVEGQMHDFKQIPTLMIQMPTETLFKVNIKPLGTEGQIGTIVTKNSFRALTPMNRRTILEYSVFSYLSNDDIRTYTTTTGLLKRLGTVQYSKERSMRLPQAPIQQVTKMIENSILHLAS